MTDTTGSYWVTKACPNTSCTWHGQKFQWEVVTADLPPDPFTCGQCGTHLEDVPS